VETLRPHGCREIKISAKESLSYHDLKWCKPQFDEICSELLDQRKQARLQWLQNQSKINRDNLNNIRCDASRHFRNKKREYLKDKIMSIEQTVRKRTMDACLEEETNLRWVTNLEVT
jgi:hypothetical protein